MAHSRGFHRPRGSNFRSRFPPFQGRPPSAMIRPLLASFGGGPREPVSSDFVIGGGPLQDVKPPKRAAPNVSRKHTAVKKPAHICVGFEASQRFPNAKEKLHNVLQGAMKGHSLVFDSREVEGKFWQSTLRIPWPRELSCYGEGPSRKEAEKNVAAIACVELEQLGVANISSSILIKKEAVQNKDEPKWIYIDDDRLSRVESFLLKNSVLSQQLYRHQNQQPSSFQAPQSYGSSTAKIVGPESVAFSKSQTQGNNNITAETNKDGKVPEFWQDSEIQDADFSRWEMPHTSNTTDLQNNTISSASSNSNATSRKVMDIFSGFPWKALSSEEHGKLNEQLWQEYNQRQRMLESRRSWFSEETKKLPVAEHREKIVDLIEANKVVVLSGETGCGKTTQIPQYILDHAILSGKGSTCNIVVTQPRRIVAMSIAERVAWERGEILGKSVGYQVRLEGTPPTQWGRILFCTTGILLRRMQNNALLQGVSHVIVDEVHERDINTDFLLILLKALLNKNQSLKIVVMSATVNSERFSQYFNSCPSLTVPGFTHSVTEYFLPDVHRMLGGISSAPAGPQQSKRFKPNNSFTKVQSEADNPEADAELVSETILHVCRNYAEGAILCFLAGWDEITTVHDVLSSKISDLDKPQFLVLPLHSMLPMFNQRAVFDRPPVGVRKIVLATNIAETSITIDDVVYVINAGNEKEQMYDAANKVSCLMTHWTSQASVTQRRGRAGRCRPGLCFNLFTKEQFEKMAPYQSAEMQRISLEEIVLQTKIQCSDCSCKVQEFLAQALDPPSPIAVQSAVAELQEIGAMDNQEDLTALGRHMAHLPVEPRIAKMIIYGTIFRCIDPVLTIAAGLSYKDPFVTPLNRREQADQSRKSFAHGSRSDHLALLNAYNGWMEAMNQSRGREFVEQRFLHWGTLNMIRGMRDQFIRLLEVSGLVPSFQSCHSINAFSGNLELVKAILCAGLFPNAVKVGLGIESKGRCGKKRVRVAFRTRTDGRVFLHPSSVNSDERQFASQWLVYHDKVKSTQVFIRDSSMVHPVALICLSGKGVREIRHEIRHGPPPSPQQPRVTLAVDGDRWMAFNCSPRLARVLQAIRAEINKMVTCSISPEKTNDALFHHHTQLIEVLSLLLTLPIQETLPSTC